MIFTFLIILSNVVVKCSKKNYICFVFERWATQFHPNRLCFIQLMWETHGQMFFLLKIEWDGKYNILTYSNGMFWWTIHAKMSVNWQFLHRLWRITLIHTLKCWFRILDAVKDKQFQRAHKHCGTFLKTVQKFDLKFGIVNDYLEVFSC